MVDFVFWDGAALRSCSDWSSCEEMTFHCAKLYLAFGRLDVLGRLEVDGVLGRLEVDGVNLGAQKTSKGFLHVA